MSRLVWLNQVVVFWGRIAVFLQANGRKPLDSGRKHKEVGRKPLETGRKRSKVGRKEC